LKLSAFKALRSRNFRLFFFGQGMSLIGTWMQRVALGWLVYDMTDSEFLLGLVAFIGQLPVSLLSPVAGVVADRIDRRKLLIYTQLVEVFQASVLAALTLTGAIEIWHIVVLSLLLGSAFAFESPTRQAFVIEMTGPEDLMNAIALNSGSFNAARLIGPALAGFMVAATGEGIVFAANAVSYVAVIAALLAMRLPEKKFVADRENAVTRIKEGFIYVYNSRPIRTLLEMLALITLVGIWHAVLMPVFAKDVLGRGPEALGILMGANGAGALSGAVMLAFRKSVRNLAKALAAAVTVFGLALVGFSLSTNFYLSVFLIYIVGISFIHEVAGTNTLVQTLVPENMRGRVMSLFILSFLGVMPFGNMIAGSVASVLGAPRTVLISGACVVIAGLFFGFKISGLSSSIHLIQEERGFIVKTPEETSVPDEWQPG